MKKKTIFATALCCAFLTACTSIAPGEQANLDESVDDLAVIEESTAANAATEASTEETPEEYNFTFNPHVYPKKLYDAYSPDEWETFTNLCNALEAGEDTFKAASRETYEWCFSGGPLDEYFPVARFALGVDFLDGYSDGVGKIIYDIPKEEFKQKLEEFEKLVADIIKENVREDYTDFEKCVALYEYMVKNYTYDWDEYSNNQSGKINDVPKGTYGTYRTFMDKKGICDDLSSVYNFLLLQCGVEAVKYEGGTGDNGHAWTYVTIDGVGYFIDPTWGLSIEGVHDLDYFMMTEAEREPDFGDTMRPVMFYYEHKNTDVDFSANDERYAELRGGDFVSMDTENKILHYTVDGEPRELHYEQ